MTKWHLPIAERMAIYLMPQLSGCLEWTGTTDQQGYGKIGIGGKRLMAHRVAWMLDRQRAIPEGQHVLHHCDNPPCCEPTHLFLGTDADNMADCLSKGRHANQKKTHCPRGHPYDEINNMGRRGCRTCRSVAAHLKYVEHRDG